MALPTRDPVAPHSRSGGPAWPGGSASFQYKIVVGWIVIVALVNVTVPQLEVVGQMRSVSMSPAERSR